jgi:hypothetical protein
MADPAHPVEVARWWFPGQWRAGGEASAPPGTSLHGGPYVEGERAYLPYGGSGLIVLDLGSRVRTSRIAPSARGQTSLRKRKGSSGNRVGTGGCPPLLGAPALGALTAHVGSLKNRASAVSSVAVHPHSAQTQIHTRAVPSRTAKHSSSTMTVGSSDSGHPQNRQGRPTSRQSGDAFVADESAPGMPEGSRPITPRPARRHFGSTGSRRCRTTSCGSTRRP